MSAREVNETHEYEASLLRFSVRQSINGGTDWNTLGMFMFRGDAELFLELMANDYEPHTLSVVEVGTQYRAVAS